MNAVQFHENVVGKIEGWLERMASLRTMDILDYQRSSGISGPLLEIGVFCGKYFSILARSATQGGDKLLGIDTFQWADEARVRKSMSLCDETASADISLWRRFSSGCTMEEILKHLGEKPRFISIDGSHECGDVFLDLVLCEQLISNQGIIAADDFLNPMTLGVNEALHLFFRQPRLVVPVAYISNKLFLAHRSRADDYRRAIEAAIVGDQAEPQSAHFRAQLKLGRHFIEQSLWGQPVLIS